MQTRLALNYLDRLLRLMTKQSFYEWVKQRRDADMQWYKVARELSQLTEVDVSPETVRRWYEHAERQTRRGSGS